jgi:hypothetical protein
MRNLIKAVSTGALVLLAGAATAAELFTAPVLVKSGATFTCKVANVSSKVRQVKIETRTSGTTLNESPELSLEPGFISVTYAYIVPAGSQNLYCHFSVKGPKSSVRGMGAVRDDSGAEAVVVVAQ